MEAVVLEHLPVTIWNLSSALEEVKMAVCEQWQMQEPDFCDGDATFKCMPSWENASLCWQILIGINEVHFTL
jgi:hypothetical protein